MSIKRKINMCTVLYTVVQYLNCPPSRSFQVIRGMHLSVYNMKNNFCLFERPLKIQKNGIFLFEKSFFGFRDIDIFLLCKLDQ